MSYDKPEESDPTWSRQNDEKQREGTFLACPEHHNSDVHDDDKASYNEEEDQPLEESHVLFFRPEAI